MISWLVVGLGNPGPQYATHRHNVGFMVVDSLRNRFHQPKESMILGGEIALLRQGDQQVCTLKPMEFMNLSGNAVSRIAHFYKIPIEHVIVVYDDLDLAFGQLKVRQGGGAGGNNGLRSIIGTIGSDFVRVRVGIGRPSFGDRDQILNYVLSPFDKAQQKQLALLLEHGVDAALAIIERGLAYAMNHYNRMVI